MLGGKFVPLANLWMIYNQELFIKNAKSYRTVNVDGFVPTSKC